jgi:hypothetical protein
VKSNGSAPMGFTVPAFCHYSFMSALLHQTLQGGVLFLNFPCWLKPIELGDGTPEHRAGLMVASEPSWYTGIKILGAECCPVFCSFD